MLINVHIVASVTQRITVQEDVHQNQTRETDDDWWFRPITSQK